MAPRVHRLVCISLTLGGLFASPIAMADTWGDLIVTSPTLPISTGYLCQGAGGIEVGCPTTAPYLTSAGLLGIGTATPTTAVEVSGTVSATTLSTDNLLAGGLTISGDSSMANISASANVSVTGNVSADKFIGDGSGLTGLSSAGGDRITSGTTSMVAYTGNNYVSVTQGGVNTAYFHPSLGLITVGVSSTGGISGTTGYFSGNVGIGTNSPSNSLHIGSSGAKIRINADTVSSGLYAYNDTTGNQAFTLTRQNITGSPGITAALLISAYHGIGFQPGASGFGADPSGTSVYIDTLGRVGIGTTAPDYALTVSGSARIGSFTSGALTNVGLAVADGPSVGRAINILSSDGNGSGLIGSSGEAGAANGLVINAYRGGGHIDFQVNGEEKVRIVASGRVGIGTTNPSATLDVSGSVKIAGTGTETCTDATVGMIRRNPVTGRLQACH